MIRHIVTAAAMMAATMCGVAASAADKNWTPPTYRIYGQKLSDDEMKANPDLLSVTLHGVPPGTTNIYTMFAGSYPDRIGNPDDPDDIDVIKKGITIVDPRWNRTNDTAPKFVVLMPMRDMKGQNVGLLVYAYKVPVRSNVYEAKLYARALTMRDRLAKKIPSYDALFAQVK